MDTTASRTRTRRALFDAPARVVLTLAVIVPAACTEAEQAEFLDTAEQVGEQVARGMDRLGERMDAMLGDTETDLDALADQLRELGGAEFREQVDPQLDDLRAELERLRDDVDDSDELTPQQRERLREVEAEVERLVERTRAAVDASDDELRTLGRELSRTLTSVQESLARLQREMEEGGGA